MNRKQNIGTLVGLIAFLLADMSAHSPFSSGQAATAPPAFEVASIRPSAPGTPPGGVSRPVGAQLRASSVTLRQLVMYAFGIDRQQHDPEPVGGPAWMPTDRFTLVASAAGPLSIADSRLMMRTLLTERFQLRTHVETREMPIYTLVRARPDGTLGGRLRRSQTDCAAWSAAVAGGTRPLPERPDWAPCGLLAGGMIGIRGTAPIADIAARMARFTEIERPIVDRTALTGTFDVELDFAQSGRDATNAGSLFTALQEQLGLKLEPGRGPVEVLMIDAAEKPMAD